MSNGTGIDHSDEPSDREPARDAAPASPGAAMGYGRAWSAVQVSRPADLAAAAQALGGDAADGGPADEAVAAAESAVEAADAPVDAPRLPGSEALAEVVANTDPAVLARIEAADLVEVHPAEEPSGGRERGGKKASKGAKAAKAAKPDKAAKAEGSGAAAGARRPGRRTTSGRRTAEAAAATAAQAGPTTPATSGPRKRIDTATYERELSRLYIELVKMQEWVKAQGLKVVVIFEGRDAAGKGGVIKRITEPLNPRYARVVALPAPTEREKGQWFFQRYVAHLPAAGEMVLFDRSWYNRAGVDRVMGFCTDEEYREFARSVPEFERMLVRSGIMVVKYWFSVSDEEQERRFRARINDPTKRWKLSPMDLQSRARWVEYSKAKDEMFTFSDIKQAPWYVVPSDDKKRARLNCIAHLLSLIPYEDLTPEPIVLPPRQDSSGYVRPPITDQTFVPERY